MTATFFMIAGEPSGDALGASLMKGLKASGVSENNIEGIGGHLMSKEGLESLWPMDDLCVMGLWEVAGHLPRLIRLIQGIVEEIEERKPDVVITIDLPDFNFRVAEKLKKRGIFKGKILHYVAPTVWAWRSGRAKKISAFLDGLMCLFPFEPDYFKPHGLKAEYVGHPLIELDKGSLDPQQFREKRQLTKDDLCVGVFLGSREKELNSLSKILLDTADALSEQYENLHLIIPTLPSMEYDVLKRLEGLQVPHYVVTDQDAKYNAFAACDAAVAVSGTVGLELAYIGVPHVIGYKAHPLTGLIMRFLLKVKYVHLANILLDDEIVPEYLQWECNVHGLTRGLMTLINYPEERAKQAEGTKMLTNMLQLEGDKAPSKKAAEFVLSHIS